MSEVKRYSFWPQIVHLPGGGGVRAEVHFKVEEDGLFVAHQDYARLKTEVERLTKAGEWQPIETAPKDMTRVLGYVEEYIVVMWWFTYSNGRSCWETVDGESEVDPTHWMPLPKPPQEGKPSV